MEDPVALYRGDINVFAIYVERSELPADARKLEIMHNPPAAIAQGPVDVFLTQS